MEFKDIVKKRYAVKKFTGEKIPKEKIDELLEMIRMSASSFGLQPWKIKVIAEDSMKEKLLPHSYNQEQITTCSHLLVFCANSNLLDLIGKYGEMMKVAGTPEEKIEGYIGMMKGFVEGLDEGARTAWATKQTYIALGNAINGATSLGVDSCPMEGFIPEKYSEILELSDNLTPIALVTIGVAADEARPKIRYSKEDMFF